MSEITDLANLIKALRAENKRFVLMLGAGASVSSDVPNARAMMKEAVERYATGASGGSIEDRFDQLMNGPEANRRTILKPYLDKKPSLGYRFLAELIRDGYFETVITFNFDTLLEKALHDVGVHDFTTIIRGEFEDSKLALAARQPGIKILKLHGSLKGVSSFIFAREDLVDYPKPIRDTVEELTAGDILVCGYAYGDQCVITSFSKDGPGNVVIVDPNPAQMLRDVARKRKGSYAFPGNDGRFDDFFGSLSAALKNGPDSIHPADQNPFKFLEAYRTEDREWFFGREEEVHEVSGMLRGDLGRAFFVSGPSKAGKTSFIRAGLMPVLKPEPLYLRCQADLEKWLPAELARRYPAAPATDLGAALKALTPAESRFYLILDQFERVVRPYEQKPKGREEFVAFLKGLMAQTPPAMTIVYVATESVLLLSTVMALGVAQHYTTVKCDAATIGKVIHKLAEQAGIGLDPEIIQQFQDRCGDPKEVFTLAHVSAVCHLLCDAGKLDTLTLKRILEDHQDTLNRMINQYDVIGFIEDIPFDAAARALLPRMLKVVSKEGRQNLAECLTSHFGELFPTLAYAKERVRAAGF